MHDVCSIVYDIPIMLLGFVATVVFSGMLLVCLCVYFFRGVYVVMFSDALCVLSAFFRNFLSLHIAFL